MWLESTLLGLLLIALSACSRQPETGPVEIHFDQDTGAYCRMMISDPRFVAEIRYFPAGKHSRVAKFDDIGCAVSWLKDKPFANDPKTEIWVADYRNKKWIDARTATYVPMPSTPMDYGLAAQSDKAKNGMDFAAATKKIAEVEAREHVHGQQLLERLRQQRLAREKQKPVNQTPETAQ